MPLRCLLIGPAETGERASGEDAYVRSLLSHPPQGVKYTHFSTLLAEGRARRQPHMHRLFAWLSADTLPDHQLIVIAREDEYTFGVLHSRVHELWARGMGTQFREVESGFRYTPTTTFETFPSGLVSFTVQLSAAAPRWIEMVICDALTNVTCVAGSA